MLQTGTINECIVGFPDRKGLLTPLHGTLTGEATFDIGVLHLKDSPLDSIGFRPITVENFSGRDDELERAWLHVTGWPADYFQRRPDGHVSSRRLRFTAMFDPGPVDHYPERHLLFPLDRNRFIDLNGNPAQVPWLDGISGSPVWKIGQRFSTCTPEVVGVQTGYVEKGSIWYVKGTRWSAVKHVIDCKFPGMLDQSLQLVAPGPSLIAS